MYKTNHVYVYVCVCQLVLISTAIFFEKPLILVVFEAKKRCVNKNSFGYCKMCGSHKDRNQLKVLMRILQSLHKNDTRKTYSCGYGIEQIYIRYYANDILSKLKNVMYQSWNHIFKLKRPYYTRLEILLTPNFMFLKFKILRFSRDFSTENVLFIIFVVKFNWSSHLFIFPFFEEAVSNFIWKTSPFDLKSPKSKKLTLLTQCW